MAFQNTSQAMRLNEWPSQPIDWRDAADRAWRALALANCLGLLAVAVWLRCWHLGNIPGVNGDEAWSGVQAQLLLRGEAISWNTPTGNPINPFFFLPQVLLHAIFPPSFVLLRIPSLASGLLALGVNYWLCRRTFGQQTARISTLILAVLPINIAYSRFAWDASQSLLFTLPVVYLPLLAMKEPALQKRWTLLGGISLAAAILVHPTNVFAAPLLLFPTAAMYYRQWQQNRSKLATKTACGTKQLAILLGALAVAILIGKLAWPWLQRSAPRWIALEEYQRFAILFPSLISGATVYEFISGRPSALFSENFNEFDLLAWSLMGAGLYGWYSLLRGRSPMARRQIPEVRTFGWSWFLTIAGFFGVAGAKAIQPHFERYGICLLAPTGLLLALGLEWWLLRRSRIGMTVFLSCGWLVLGGFWLQYMQVFLECGGRSHQAFRTAEFEPRQAALDYIQAHATNEVSNVRPVRIVAGDWWTYWPLRYLSLGKPGLEVYSFREIVPDDASPDQPQIHHDANWQPPRIDWYVDVIPVLRETTDAPDRAGRMGCCDVGQELRDPQGGYLLSIFHVNDGQHETGRD